MTGNRVKIIDTPLGICSLKYLYLDKNQIVSFQNNPLSCCTKLEVLTIKENRIRSLTDMGTINTLKRFDITSNKIIDVLQLSNLNMPNLEELNFLNNQIENEPFARYCALYYIPSLSVVNNKIITMTDREKAKTIGSPSNPLMKLIKLTVSHYIQ
ncbi:hypothetical protein ROZALSC1DRAFT_26424 [Rozella allomycis CSF55]|uniref:L domain-like protein n=1 Tax=Rozella allomycis (strain CSF55) TaxID=988480 RepID=A0A075AMT7_ROZAC|nr:hypothetical protein O9G_001475 [Rozella allomycis CSF55]RKP22180.1 hypothetical protein ROZALSC1DRAFT_26424 [Rozella allomycis CSF55]|eukprot:EPZ31001.1 hypothetical protein O9G_001475 [Rozella allomycis CSF55]